MFMCQCASGSHGVNDSLWHFYKISVYILVTYYSRHVIRKQYHRLCADFSGADSHRPPTLAWAGW